MWVTSWWDETPWPEIREDARLILSPKQFREWLTRPDVVERMGRGPKRGARCRVGSGDGGRSGSRHFWSAGFARSARR